MGIDWGGVKKTGALAAQVGGIATGNPWLFGAGAAAAGKGNDLGTQFDKKFISGDWQAKRDEQAKAEAEQQRNAARQEELIGGVQRQGEEFFAGAERRASDRYGYNREYTGKAQQNLGQNTRRIGEVEDEFTNQQRELDRQARANADDATNVYQTMTPHYNDMIQYASKEAKNAMTIDQAMNANNAVATQTRGLYDQYGNDLRAEYNKEAGAAQAGYNTLAGQAQSGYTDLAGQTQQNYDQYGQASQDRYNAEAQAARQRFEDAAAGENRLGLSNYGILASLGAQAAGQMGAGGPMTLGQQLGNLAAANRQAGEAYANTQRRMQSLKDQGLMSEGDLRKMGLSSRDVYAREGLGTSTGQREKGLASMLGLKEKGLDTKQNLRNLGLAGQQDLRRAGLDKGFERSDIAYQMGLNARDRYRNSLADRENLTDRNITRQSALRGERTGYQGNIRGSQTNKEQTRFGNQMTGDTLSRDVELARLSDLDQLGMGRVNFGQGIAGMRMGREDINTERALGNIQARIAEMNAEEARRRQMLGAGIQTAGTVAGGVAGGVFGGPGGAMMGAQAGGMLGGAAGSAFGGGPAPTPQYTGAQAGMWNPQGWSGPQVQAQVQQPQNIQIPGAGMGPQYQPYSGPNSRYNLGVNPYAAG